MSVEYKKSWLCLKDIICNLILKPICATVDCPTRSRWKRRMKWLSCIELQSLTCSTTMLTSPMMSIEMCWGFVVFLELSRDSFVLTKKIWTGSTKTIIMLPPGTWWLGRSTIREASTLCPLWRWILNLFKGFRPIWSNNEPFLGLKIIQ